MDRSLMTSMATNYSLIDSLHLQIIKSSGGLTVLSGLNANPNPIPNMPLIGSGR